MSRSILKYLLEQEDMSQEEKPSILNRVGSHLKNHWKKYAVGAGVVGAGLLAANPAWLAKTGSVVRGAAQKVGKFASKHMGEITPAVIAYDQNRRNQ